MHEINHFSQLFEKNGKKHFIFQRKMKTIKWKAFSSTRVDRCSRTKLQPSIYSTNIQVYIQSMMSLFEQFQKNRKQILVAEFYFYIIYSSNSTIPYS